MLLYRNLFKNIFATPSFASPRYRQQVRAYCRASGFKAACELLRTSEGAPQLQSRVLSTLGEVLSATAPNYLLPITKYQAWLTWL